MGERVSMTSLNELKDTHRTKRYADDHQILLKTHLGESHKINPSKPKKRLVGTHKDKRKRNLFKMLRKEGWL